MKIIEITNSNFDKNYIKQILLKKTCFIGIFSKSCIHCQNMQPEWKKLKEKLGSLKCNGILLEIDAEQLNYIDYSSLSDTLQGFPAILVFKNGKKSKDYEGERTSEQMFKFVKPYLVMGEKNTRQTKTNNKKLKKTKGKTKKGKIIRRTRKN